MSEVLVDALKFRDGTLMGVVVQTAYSQSGTVATGTTTTPYDNTIPQSSEGTQFMSVSITPRNVNNILKVTTVFWGAISATSTDLTVALFRDSIANALSAVSTFGATNQRVCLTFVHYVVAGSLDATTFKVRAGGSSASTITFNGSGGGQIFGGVAGSSITVEEIQGE